MASIVLANLSSSLRNVQFKVLGATLIFADGIPKKSAVQLSPKIFCSSVTDGSNPQSKRFVLFPGKNSLI